jgi:sugar (pentulose or hexulose) kinase
MHRNARVGAQDYPTLDLHAIERWLAEGLAAFALAGDIVAIVPVGHGAAACIVGDEGLSLAPLDYEAEPPPDVRRRYHAMRDDFALTGSPQLPGGLNLGSQLLWLETIAPEKFARGLIVTWPQYWAWRLSGVAATEITSLGCHTDLWAPAEGRPSPMAKAAGWAERLAPLRLAGDVLGHVTREWRDRCGLPADCAVLCGLHDSNAALLAARSFGEVSGRDCTILSTGTWFVALRSVAERGEIDLASLPEHRDCLVNIDAAGMPVPSARFMGGREVECIESAASAPIDIAAQKDSLLRTAETAVKKGRYVLPSFHKGVGPFPANTGYWIQMPGDQLGRRALAGLYLALVTSTCLDLIGCRDAVVVEGRFADDSVFTGALAALRQQPVYKAGAGCSIAHGALSLIDTQVSHQAALEKIDPLSFDIASYAAQWRSLANDAQSQ